MKAYIDSVVTLPKKSIDVEAVKHALTVKYFLMGDPEPQHVYAFSEDEHYMYVPRHYGLHLIAKMDVELHDLREKGKPRRFPKEVVHTGDYAYQKAFVENILRQARSGKDFIVQAATGKGKCLAKGTHVLLYDGRTVPVEKIKVGDLLMGPDSLPRTVLSTTTGREEMFEVVPVKGATYVVNRSHILSLRISGISGKRVLAGDGAYYQTGDIVDISLDNYRVSSPTFRHVAKGWRTGVDFVGDTHTPIPAYVLGSWLGDGSSRHPMLYCNDVEVVKEWRVYATALGLSLTKTDDEGVDTYRLSGGLNNRHNQFMCALRELNLLENKHIPDEYKTASRKVRLELLAGIVDTDGCVSCGCFDVVFVNRRLADDLAYVARSLGYAAYVYPCSKGCQTGAVGTYYRVRISGPIAEVPCRVLRKKVGVRVQKKNVLNVGVTVRSVGEGEYCGFELTGDGRFLLGDFTVTHNTVCSLSVIQKLGRTALVIVDQDNLMQQWITEAQKVLGVTPEQVGRVQGKVCDYEGKHVVVAMMQSLVQREYPPEFYSYFGTVVFDEVHTAGAPTFSQALMMFPAVVRFGVSATVDRRDALQRVLHWNLGDVEVALLDKHDKSYVYYIESASVYSWYANISPKTGRIITEVAEDPVRNLLLVEAIKWLYETGRDVLVISDRIEQLENLMVMAAHEGVPEEEMGLYCGCRNVWLYEKNPMPKRKPLGYEKGTAYTPVMLTRVRKRIPKKELAQIKEKAKIIFATFGMFSKGVDVPRLSGGVDCTPRSKAQQVHGRILRKQEGKEVPIWVTVRDINSYRIDYQFLQRIDEYVSSSAEIYLWNPSRGIRLQDAKALRRNLHSNIKSLKAMTITTCVDGNYTLSTQTTQSGREEPPETRIGKTTPYRRVG